MKAYSKVYCRKGSPRDYVHFWESLAVNSRLGKGAADSWELNNMAAACDVLLAKFGN